MSEVLVGVGDTVNAGDLIGKSGNSGRSTGPHLHYEVRRNGDALNPLPFIKAGRKIEKYL
jgi:murein DD-endopeptidase MepM/ murein hydrolase activator NlpD